MRETFECRSIGVVRSPFRELAETPRQPRAAEGVRGSIEFAEGWGLEDAIADLEGWDYAWVLFWFHLAPRPHDGRFRAKVLPPRSERKRGVLSTRSPHRPNPIGLSVVRIVEVRGRVLEIADLDLVDGTPVLDVKPYVPWTDAIPSARTGWLTPPDGALPGGARPADPRPTWRVVLTPRAVEQLQWLTGRGLGYDLERRLVDALALGPQPHAYRRIKEDALGLRIAVKEWYARFRTVDVEGVECIEVTSLESGRRDDERDGLHAEFVTRFGARSLR